MRTAATSTLHHDRAAEWLGLAAWLALTFAAAAFGSIASIEASEFYRELERPAWAPPGAIFAPVWSLLYLMMGVAAWLVWRDHGWRGALVPLTVYVLQLALNALWSWLFFEWHEGEMAFVAAVALAAAVALTALLFARLNRIAGLLLVPYLAWVTFASFLAYTVWQLNPDRLA